MSNKYNNLNNLISNHDAFGDIPDYTGSRSRHGAEATHDALAYYAGRLTEKKP